MTTAIRSEIRTFLKTNFYVPDGTQLGDDDSLLDLGIVDSTGVLELVGFLEEKYGISIDDQELIPDNLDSVGRLVAFIAHKTGGEGQRGAA
ncbi:MAG: acyl carrier protein [Polyangiaceae bacterium]|jgi:acyl carrier protein|nr:acyl carrier protein [Polyangiaceae bacterium]